MDRYLSYARYLKGKYGTSAYRVAIDAGFSCPNRGANRENPGCSFCDQAGSLAVYQDSDRVVNTSERLIHRKGTVDLSRQIERGIDFLNRRYSPEIFLLYLQSFSNTFAPVEELKELYDYCLSRHKFHELIIATRPDCMSPQIADLIASYATNDFDVWVELGLQSAHDETLNRIGRGHTVEVFDRAYRLLTARGVKVGVHMIFGLPGETTPMIMDSVDHVSKLGPAGVKIHDLHVVKGTRLHEELLEGKFMVANREQHLEWIIEALTRLPSDTVILRLTSDTPADRLIAPETRSDKQPFMKLLNEQLKLRGLRQGGAVLDTRRDETV